MKRLIALAILLLLGFYVAWPGWSGYQIATAIKARDNATLERKIVFASVRDTLKPLAVQRVGEVYDQQLGAQAGPAGAAILAQIKADVVPKIVETALVQLVTAPNLIRVVNDGGTIKENAERILKEQVGKIGLPGLGGGGGAAGPVGSVQLPGGLGQIAGKLGIPGLGGQPKAEAAQPAPKAAGTASGAPAAGGEASRQFGISNIKRFSFLGPLAFEVGVAREAASAQPDVVVEMRFLDGDWRVVGVKPRV